MFVCRGRWRQWLLTEEVDGWLEGEQEDGIRGSGVLESVYLGFFVLGVGVKRREEARFRVPLCRFMAWEGKRLRRFCGKRVRGWS